MPILTRRRLQVMLDDVAKLSLKKANDLLARLENKRVEQALPAEMELALLWALSKLGEIDIEPEWWADDHRPEAYTEALLDGQPTIIEITAPSDASIGGSEAMDYIAHVISEYANKIQRRLGTFLYFRFQAESGYENGSYFRRRLAPSDYNLSDNAATLIRNWITSGAFEHDRLRIVEPGLDVEIEKQQRKQIRFHNTWSSMPPETHSLEDNPLFISLKKKRKQVEAAPPGILRLIFLADVGSTLLNRLGTIAEIDPTRRRISGKQIISHFVSRHRDCVDAVVVFAPIRNLSLMQDLRMSWMVTIFSRPGLELPSDSMNKLVAILPKPRFEGYQARSLHLQGAFAPTARAWYLGMHVEYRRNKMEVKVSARALLDLLAGRITAEQFRSRIDQRKGEVNAFQRWLDQGYTLAGIGVESGGVDKDDDFLVLSFSDDPAARPLRLQEKTGDSARRS